MIVLDVSIGTVKPKRAYLHMSLYNTFMLKDVKKRLDTRIESFLLAHINHIQMVHMVVASLGVYNVAIRLIKDNLMFCFVYSLSILFIFQSFLNMGNFIQNRLRLRIT